MPGSQSTAPRCAALVGPYLSGKTTLMESLLHAAGAIHRRGSVKDGNTVGDALPEARDRHMSVELNVAHAEYLGERWTLLDCPGSVEFTQDTFAALSVADIAVVVCEPAPEKALALTPLLHFLDDKKIPHVIFINKLDTATNRIPEVLDALQSVSERPLLLRQVPLREGDDITGYVDLVSERAYAYRKGEPSKLIKMPEEIRPREEEARQELLEALADFDDDLLEKLLEDVTPSNDQVYNLFAKDVAEDLVVPVLIGMAEQESGITRLWKTLRHDCPAAEVTAERIGAPDGELVAQVFKTLHVPHVGKLSISRVWRGAVKDGQALGDLKVSGVNHLMGRDLEKATGASAGDVVALGRLDEVKTGDVLTAEGIAKGAIPWPEIVQPVYAQAISTERHEDEVRLSTGLAKIVEEDPSLVLESNSDTHELLVCGQGEIHIKTALEKLKRQYNVPVLVTRPSVPYKETIQGSVTQRARHKKQSGGHGEFGEVHLNIRPLPRGSGFNFDNTVTGGSVPKQYIPSVEAGVRDYMVEGPLGFPVVDIAVTLTDGLHHSVDSSDMAFRKAGILAMKEGLPTCKPVLLEPINEVKISIPNTFTSNAQALISRRRGQFLGFDAKAGWKGWDEITAYLPQSEMGDLIIELRSQTQGIGTFEWRFAHLVELTGRLADEVIQHRREAA